WIGSSSTLRGLESQRPLFERIGREIPEIRLRIIADRTAGFDPLAVEFFPWSEATEVEAISACQIGISWIPDDLWSRGKCGLKVLQYMAAGLPVVANPYGVSPTMIESGVHGVLASTPAEWTEAIVRLANDAELRRRMGAASRKRFEAEY